MQRREFLKCSAGAALSGTLLSARTAEGNTPSTMADGQVQRRPNVLIVLADQWRAQATGHAGDPQARTPHIDRMAGQNINFGNAVSCCPVCSPYRASLLTGQYPLTHGVFLNDVCLRDEGTSLAEAFSAAGYHTGVIGKWHLDGHGRSNFTPPERRQGFQYWKALECTHNYNKSPYYAGDDPTRRVWEGYDAIAQTDDAIDYIKARREEPFLLYLSWGPPHNPYETAPPEYRELYDPEAIVLRGNVPASAERQARIDLAGYYAHCTALDDCLGRLLATLQQTGLDEHTIVLFTSDHGDMLGSHGVQRKQKPWDESIRVPMVFQLPARLRAESDRGGRSLEFPLNTPDLMPTLLGLCGLDIPDSVEGVDRSAIVRGLEPDRDDAALIMCPSPFGEWRRSAGGREYRGARTSRWTYVRDLDGPWLLFDNETDPLQRNNLVGHPSFAELQRELEDRLATLLHATGDRFEPGAEYIRHWGYVTDQDGTVPYR